MIGLVITLVVLVGATVFGLWRRRVDGRVVRPSAAVSESTLGRAELGHDLGSRATLVQFSSAFCQPCRAARATLSHVASTVPGVVHVEIDAESHLDLVRRLEVMRTPTTFVLDPAGRVLHKATGAPRLTDVHAALPS
ncbi:MAG: TlpA family protein disulfide reductase [Jiangellaceae bacterium]